MRHGLRSRDSTETAIGADSYPLQLRLPGTDLSVSRLCLGTASLGVKQSDSEAFALLDAYAELGGNFIDTARVYSDWVPGERSRCERILGDWLRSRPELRQRMVVATKGGHYEWSDKARSRVDPQSVRSDIERSLDALGIDTLPVWFLHRDNPKLPAEEIVGFLNTFVEEGKVRHLAVANWKSDRIAVANLYAREQGIAGFVASQPQFSLGSWAMSREVVDPTLAQLDEADWAFHNNSQLPLIPYSAQAKGFFSKVTQAGEAALQMLAKSPYYTIRNLIVARKLKQFAGSMGKSVNAIVLAYALQQPFPCFPIIGGHQPEMLTDSFSALGVRLSESEWDELHRATRGGSD